MPTDKERLDFLEDFKYTLYVYRNSLPLERISENFSSGKIGAKENSVFVGWSLDSYTMPGGPRIRATAREAIDHAMQMCK